MAVASGLDRPLPGRPRQDTAETAGEIRASGGGFCGLRALVSGLPHYIVEQSWLRWPWSARERRRPWRRPPRSPRAN